MEYKMSYTAMQIKNIGEGWGLLKYGFLNTILDHEN
jgi:hypothetical protein